MAKIKIKKTPWYSEAAGFFGPEYLKEYAGVLTPERTATEVGFLVKALKLKRGASILDCPCGHGRHAIELARRGYHVTGQDLNAFFLRTAKQAARRADVSVRWVVGDLREIPFTEEFDVALNLFTAFGYLESDEEDCHALRAVANALKPGGRFVLDVMNRDHLVRVYREKVWDELPDGSIVVSARSFDHLTGRKLERRVRIGKRGERQEVKLSVRMYTITELATMLRTVGLHVQDVYGSYSGELLTFDSKRYILIAHKD